MSRSILVIDDELSIRETLKGALGDEDYQVSLASSGKEGLGALTSVKPDLILLDIWMPELDGIETLKQIKEKDPSQAVIMMSGHGTIETAVRATKLGAFDFVEKPVSLERLLVLIENACQASELSRENVALRKQVEKRNKLIGESEAMKQIFDMIKQVGPTTGSVLITGENGTGKEVVANSIHAHSQRYSKPFVEVNCAAIPEELIESELFGHEKGAFTGATQQRRGKFDLANGGTLFLDEIGDMSLKTQAKILRILQEQKFERVGGTQLISVDVRIIAATNKDLKQGIKNNTFREDLYYRLNVIPVHLPPLRDRAEDVPRLANHFIKEISQENDKAPRELDTEAMEALKSYPWPGNVRELRNLIERVIILTPESDRGKPVTAALLLKHLKGSKAVPAGDKFKDLPTGLRDARQAFEKDFILKTLKEHEGNISRTAAALGIERSHLHRKIKSYGIEV